MGSITLTNIPQFVEQPGRTITKTIGQLDRMMVPFTGPWNVPVPFQEGSPDSIYPLMFCIGYDENDNGGLHELKVNYAGVAITSGSIPYRTDPLIQVTPVQGSRDFQDGWYAANGFFSTSTIGAAGPTGGTLTLINYQVGTQRVNVRYIGTSLTLRYFTIPKPTFDKPFYQTMGLPLVEFEILSSYRGEISIVGSAMGIQGVNNILNNLHIAGVPPLFAAYLGMTYTQVGQWYEVEETYGPTF